MTDAQGPLQEEVPGGELLLQAQAVGQYRHPPRQTRRTLPVIGDLRRYPGMAHLANFPEHFSNTA